MTLSKFGSNGDGVGGGGGVVVAYADTNKITLYYDETNQTQESMTRPMQHGCLGLVMDSCVWLVSSSYSVFLLVSA